MLLPAVLLLVVGGVFGNSHAAGLQPFRGVAGVRVVGKQQAEAAVGDTLVVRVRELDGWLIAQMRDQGKVLILGEKYFDADQYHRWLTLLIPVALADKHGKEYFGKWIQTSLANVKAGDPNWDLFQAYAALRQEVWEEFYLVLGNGRLKHINAEQPYDFSPHEVDADGVTYNDVVFKLTYSAEDEPEWRKISRGGQYRVPHAVRIGFDNGVAQYTLDTVVPEKMRPPTMTVPLNTGRSVAGAGFAQNFDFIAYSKYSLAAGVLLVLVMLAAFFYLAAKTGLVRDPDLPARKDGVLQFNLARCQMAFWFLLLTVAYIFLWVVKGETDTLTDQCLQLLGISTGTTVASVLISKSAASRTTWETYCPFKGGPGRFFWELLSDGAGKITFYRFQWVVWTLALGLVFIKSVCSSLAMPTFGTNELALMGISAGTYLAFKFPEHAAAPAEEKKPDEATE
jgi:hypothetical protein